MVRRVAFYVLEGFRPTARLILPSCVLTRAFGASYSTGSETWAFGLATSDPGYVEFGPWPESPLQGT